MRPRIARKHVTARQHIVEAARVVARRDGVRSLTIDAVAQQADVSKPSVYYYFRSKDDLIRTLAFEECRAECRAVREALDAAPSATAAVESFVRAFVAHYVGNLEMFKIGYVWSQILGLDPEKVDDTVGPEVNALLDALVERLTKEQVAGRVRPHIHLRRFALTVWTSALGVVTTMSVLDSAQQRLRHDPGDLVATLTSALCHGVFVEERDG
jgi:TetR/AcrR family transcriptional regulator